MKQAILEFCPEKSNKMKKRLFSGILQAGSYTVYSGGTLTNPDESWNGWYSGGSWSGGTQLGTFNSNSMTTTVGSSGGWGPGSGPGGRP